MTSRSDFVFVLFDVITARPFNFRRNKGFMCSYGNESARMEAISLYVQMPSHEAIPDDADDSSDDCYFNQLS